MVRFGYTDIIDLCETECTAYWTLCPGPAGASSGTPHANIYFNRMLKIE
jgi:hypothetical protein